jgi:hypothetical protein
MVEPPEPDSLLYTLPNVVLTPHIAGSVGAECRRMGRYMVDELERYVAGKPLKWMVTPEAAQNTSHRPVATVNDAPANNEVPANEVSKVSVKIARKLWNGSPVVSGNLIG